MEWIGVIGIVAGLVFFVIAAMKGWNVLVTSLVTAVIIAATNGMDIMNAMVGSEKSYVTGLAGFVQKNLLIFMGGAIMGEFMDKSGAAKSIAKAIMGKVGTKSPYLVLLGIAAIGAILTYAGISMFVAMFALIPLARPMFKECNIPWHLFCAAWTLGACSFTMAMIPGVPAVAWINAANGCGVSMTAAPIMGIVGSVIAIAVSCLYIKFALKRAQAKGEVYVADENETAEASEEKAIPSLGVSLLPLVLLIAIIIIGSQLGVANIVYIAMVAAIIVSMIVFNKYISSQRDVLGNGAKSALGPAVFTSAAVGVGTVAAAAVGFQIIQGAIFNMPGGTYSLRCDPCCSARRNHGLRLGCGGHHRHELPGPLSGNRRRSCGSREDHRHLRDHRRCPAELRRDVRHAGGNGFEPRQFVQAHRRHLHWRGPVRSRRHDHHGDGWDRLAIPCSAGARTGRVPASLPSAALRCFAVEGRLIGGCRLRHLPRRAFHDAGGLPQRRRPST